MNCLSFPIQLVAASSSRLSSLPSPNGLGNRIVPVASWASRHLHTPKLMSTALTHESNLFRFDDIIILDIFRGATIAIDASP